MSFLTRSAAYSSRRGGGLIVTPPPVGNLYPWFPDFDLNIVPYVRAAGAYGAQEPVNAPNGPNTTTMVGVNNTSQFNANVGNGRAIVVQSGATIANVFINNAIDQDIIIENGAQMGRVVLTGNATRVRTRGEVSGGIGTGLIVSLESGGPGVQTDIIFDGLNSMSGGGVAMESVSRMAIVNSCFKNPAQFGTAAMFAEDVVIAGCNALQQAAGWIGRYEHQYLRYCFYRCDLRGTQNAVLRPGMNSTGQPQSRGFYVGYSTIVNSRDFTPTADGACVRTSNSSGETVPIRSVFLQHSTIFGKSSIGDIMECQPTSGRCDYWGADFNVYDGDGTSPNIPAPGPGEIFLDTNATRINTGTIAPWNDRNNTGDPALLP